MPDTGQSLPLWERGLKWVIWHVGDSGSGVAPFVGAWIEISISVLGLYHKYVAPFVGAWIEIPKIFACSSAYFTSLPLWERGLKCFPKRLPADNATVAPFVGAWIEIRLSLVVLYPFFCRSLCGSVD